MKKQNLLPSTTILVITCVILLLTSGCNNEEAGTEADIPAVKEVLTPPANREASGARDREVVFAIGKEDKSLSGFEESGFGGVEEFTCTAGPDGVQGRFPGRIYRPSARMLWESTGVARITINFALRAAYSDLILRIARWGAETTVVTVDGKQQYRVTKELCGCDEDVWGGYNLPIGGLSPGDHAIELSVAEDGRANGRFGIDALTLFADRGPK